MESRSAVYIKKAELFEAMAREAKEEAARITYKHLAWSYRQLGIHAARNTNGAELDGIAERMVGTGRSLSSPGE